MGTCYSKDASESKPPQSKRELKRKKCDTDALTAESVPLCEGDKTSEDAPAETGTAVSKIDSSLGEDSRSSTPELLPEQTDEKRIDRGVAPSDSGIESIGTAADDAVTTTDSVSKQSQLAKRLERLSRGSCSRCGNFKLDDCAFTALLADTYCLCGPRQAGKPGVNPNCQTHGNHSPRKQSPSHTTDTSNGQVCNKSEDNVVSDDLQLKSSLKKANGGRKDKNLRISIRSTDSLEMALTLLSLSEGYKLDVSDISINNKKYVKAPLAQFDSMENNLNSSPSSKSGKRRSLLSEILDITDSICRCDFYSNEYCCTSGQHLSENTNNTESFEQAHCYENGVDSGSQNVCDNPCEHESPTSEQLCSHSSDKSNAASKKTASLPKNVSFATHATGELDESKLYATISGTVHSESVMSEESSGVFTYSNTSTSEPLLVQKPKKNSHKRTASLSSRGVLLSDSSSEALDCGTEEDMASLDLDSLSRATSLSYSSIRHLVESTEDLVSPLSSARKMMVDGVECIVIPTETYYQMQSDLTTLKQQLLCLSSLIQEGADGVYLSSNTEEVPEL
ncbi:uncharacterized protein LOC131954871 isoform X2 [Physella acuta]|uniref:uncharacterized protein LOC131954871 isoform X2 n=1 Tax=Physella acuta TaxID=109671 RepID=UPI0027DDFC1B|nr:uncharacterized protein LOC131954871 isoform X2 [Physella acuta]